jgi:hypothetical protein
MASGFTSRFWSPQGSIFPREIPFSGVAWRRLNTPPALIGRRGRNSGCGRPLSCQCNHRGDHRQPRLDGRDHAAAAPPAGAQLKRRCRQPPSAMAIRRHAGCSRPARMSGLEAQRTIIARDEDYRVWPEAVTWAGSFVKSPFHPPPVACEFGHGRFSCTRLVSHWSTSSNAPSRFHSDVRGDRQSIAQDLMGVTFGTKADYIVVTADSVSPGVGG